jgi:MoaA/NifB/PqqE/SkfB family radical SAM enzyme
MHPTCNRVDEIPSQKLLELIDDIANMGVRAVIFSGGGEPLIHPAIKDSFALCQTRGLQYALLTNGQALNQDMASYLFNAKWVRLSIDYWDGESLNEFRGVSGKLFTVIMNNWKFFIENKKEGCDAGINYIITKENYTHIEHIAGFVKDLGSHNIRFCPMYNNDFLNYHKTIKQSVYERIAKADILYGDENFHIYSTYGQLDETPMHRPYKKCYFCQINPVIGADLNLYLCHDTAYLPSGIFGSVKDKTFSDVWYSKEAQNFIQNFDAQKVCDGYQCSSEGRNLFIHELLNFKDDPYI